MTQPEAPATPDSSNVLEKLLDARVIAIVGLSRDATKPSNQVARFLLQHGRTIIPVNPQEYNVLDQTSYPSLDAIPDDVAKTIQLVNVFRKPEHTPDIARQAAALKAKHGTLQGLWLQLGIENEQAQRIAQQSGLAFVHNRCLKIELQNRT